MPLFVDSIETQVNDSEFESVFKFKNESSYRLFVNKFDLLPDIYFSRSGEIKVTKGAFEIFNNLGDAQNLQDFQQFPIRQKILHLDPFETVEVFVRSNNEKTVKLGISYNFDLLDEPQSSILIPFSLSEKSQISQQIELFPVASYDRQFANKHIAPIDFTGYTKLQLTIESNSEGSPLVTSNIHNEPPIDLAKFNSGYRGNNGNLSKVGSETSSTDGLSFVYEHDEELFERIDAIEGTTARLTKFTKNLNFNLRDAWSFNSDGYRFATVRIKPTDSTKILVSYYSMASQFDIVNAVFVESIELNNLTQMSEIFAIKLFFELDTGLTILAILYQSPSNALLLSSFTKDNNIEYRGNTEVLDSIGLFHDFSLSLLSSRYVYVTYMDNNNTRITLRSYYLTSTRIYSLGSGATVSSLSLRYPQFSGDGLTFTAYHLVNGVYQLTIDVLAIKHVLPDGFTPTISTVSFSQLYNYNFSFDGLKIFFQESSNRLIELQNIAGTVGTPESKGWAFYDQFDEPFFPTGSNGSYNADVAIIDTFNDSNASRDTMFIVSSVADFNLDLLYYYLKSVQESHAQNVHSSGHDRSGDHMFTASQNLILTTVGKRVHTEITNRFELWGSASPNFGIEELLFSRDNWDGTELTHTVSTSFRYMKMKKVVSYNFIIDDYSRTIPLDYSYSRHIQAPIRPVPRHTFPPFPYNAIPIFYDGLPSNGSEFQPNRFGMYYGIIVPEVLPESVKSFLNYIETDFPTNDLFEFKLLTKRNLTLSTIKLGLEIKGSDEKWFTLKESIGDIAPIGQTVITIDDFNVDPEKDILIPRGIGLLRLLLTVTGKVKLSVYGILS